MSERYVGLAVGGPMDGAEIVHSSPRYFCETVRASDTLADYASSGWADAVSGRFCYVHGQHLEGDVNQSFWVPEGSEPGFAMKTILRTYHLGDTRRAHSKRRLFYMLKTMISDVIYRTNPAMLSEVLAERIADFLGRED